MSRLLTYHYLINLIQWYSYRKKKKELSTLTCSRRELLLSKKTVICQNINTLIFQTSKCKWLLNHSNPVATSTMSSHGCGATTPSQTPVLHSSLKNSESPVMLSQQPTKRRDKLLLPKLRMMVNRSQLQLRVRLLKNEQIEFVQALKLIESFDLY